VGWIYQYALVDRSGTMDAGQLRALQDWFLKYELKTVPNVAEVASVGGMVRQYQVVLDPDKLAPTASRTAWWRGHPEGQPGSRRLGARTGRGRIHGARLGLPAVAGRLPGQVPLITTDRRGVGAAGRRGRIQVGPEMRRGIGELDGEGEGPAASS
jgi:Cu(I)/Ag(I) efflux system membrane protein CusA/SilA